MKIAINTLEGGFSLSKECKAEIFSLLTKEEREGFDYSRDIPRNHPALIKAIEKLGNKANGVHAQINIIEIPDDVIDWYISEDSNGIETVCTGRVWSYDDVK